MLARALKFLGRHAEARAALKKGLEIYGTHPAPEAGGGAAWECIQVSFISDSAETLV